MYINIPVVKSRNYNQKTNEVTSEKSELTVKIETSFLAHYKWEQEFQQQMQCDLLTYTERVSKMANNEDMAKANLLGILKLLYCYIDSDEIKNFKEFLSILDLEVADEILKVLSDVLTIVMKSATTEKK